MPSQYHSPRTSQTVAIAAVFLSTLSARAIRVDQFSANAGGRAARGALALWHYGPCGRLTCARSREGKCVHKSRVEQARSATGSIEKSPLSCGRSSSQEKPRAGVRSVGLLHEPIVVPGRFAPDAGIILAAGKEQLRGCFGGPCARLAPEAPRSSGSGWRSRLAFSRGGRSFSPAATEGPARPALQP
jgi:hypothetical protein